MKKVVIAGGGIAGLSLGFALQQRHVDVAVLERADRPGGNIRTANIDGFLCEWGPNGFLDNAPETLRLVEALGLTGRVVRSSDAARRRFIYRGGGLHEVPMGPGAFLTSGLLSLRGKLRIAAEPWAKPAPGGDETIYAFAARRIGSEAASVMVDPMVSGIFAGNARELSLAACFAKMVEMESQYGGLFRALLAKRREAAGRKREGGIDVGPTGTLTSFVGGTQDLIDALAARLGPALSLNTEVTGLSRGASGWDVATSRGPIAASAVVLAGAAGVSANLVQPLSYGLSATLRQIPSAPLAVVCLGYDEADLTRTRGPLDGFGFLVPRGEGLRILGALWDSSVYPHRAPEGRALIRVMIGGASDPQILSLSDDELLQTARDDLRRAMNLSVQPVLARVIRHPLGIPQYTVGHLDRLAEIDRRLAAWPGLFLGGNAYRGPSINACIADADRLADAVTARVHPTETTATEVVS
ncbi:MAG: protoporphyrinogen oxidase [Acidobacteria bacterium]|nr:protoporphyrinogen oxidase [Acidobacteriota bacterium]